MSLVDTYIKEQMSDLYGVKCSTPDNIKTKERVSLILSWFKENTKLDDYIKDDKCKNKSY